MALQPSNIVPRSGLSVRFIGLGLCLSFTLFFLWPHPPASLLLLVVAAVLAYLRLEIAIALLPLAFPYFLFLKPLSSSGSPAFSIAELALWICLGVALIRHAVLADERRASRAWLAGLWKQAGMFLLPGLLLLVGGALSSLVSPVQHDSLRAYVEEIIEPLLYFLLMLRYLRTRTDVARTVGALVLSMVLVACIGIGQGLAHLKGLNGIIDPTTDRIGAFTYSENSFGFLMDCAIPLLLAVAFLGVRQPSNGAGAQASVWRDPLRWLCLVVLLPLVWGLYWSDSRGAEVALLVVAFAFLLFELRNKLAVLITGGAGVLGVVVLWPRIMAIVNEKGHANIAERFYIWKAGLLMVRDHVLLGSGLGSFNTLFRKSYRVEAIDGQTVGIPSPIEPHPHNFILDFWISAGLLGAVSVIWLLGAFAVVVARTYRACAGLPQAGLLKRVLLGLAGCVLASAIHGLVDSYYFLPDLALLFWFFMGVLLALRAIIRQESAGVQDKVKTADEKALAA